MRKQAGYIRNLFLTLASLLLSIFILLSITYVYIDSQLPDVDALKNVQLPIPLRVFTSDGQLMAEFGELRRDPVKIKQVPPLLIKAILATEDQRFYEHPGVDFWGLMRASTELLLTGTKSQGGSTITMQVARNFFLTRQKTFGRKLTEIMLSLKIERELTKDEILELYLNKIYLGNRAYGVSAAAQIYFNKSLNQLSLPEMALIAGLPKAPSTINPAANPIAAKDRRNHVLTRMHDLGYINQKAYEQAINTPVNTTFRNQTINVKAPYVAEMVRDMMVTSFGDDAYTKGFNVYTTIDSQQQLAANTAVRNALLAYDQRHGYRGALENLGNPSSQKTNTWLEALLKIPTVNGLRAAAIVNVTDSSATAILSDGSLITIPWPGLSWARTELGNGGHLGRSPKTAYQVVKVGDVIRAQKNNNGAWALSQVPVAQGSLIALNPQNGAITSLVGGFDFNQSKFNRVTQAHRQPGSSFKPYIYAAALAKGYTLASIFNDAPLVFSIPGQGVWRPQNDEHIFRGPIRLRFALALSVNLVSVRLLEAIDVPYALKYIARFGFDPNQLPRNLTLALGSGEVTPLEHARGYAVFANGGYRVSPYFIDHVTDNHGAIVYQAQPKLACSSCISSNTNPPTNDNTQYAPQAIPPQIAFLMTSALQDVIKYGTGRPAASLNRSDIAGKTGTTNDQVDTWFAGFNSDVVAVAWVGFDQPASLYEYGAQAALPMWIDFMRTALQSKPEHTMPQPQGIITEHIDPTTGATSPGGMLEYFTSDAPPQQAITPPPVVNGTGNNSSGNSNSDPLF